MLQKDLTENMDIKKNIKQEVEPSFKIRTMAEDLARARKIRAKVRAMQAKSLEKELKQPKVKAKPQVGHKAQASKKSKINFSSFVLSLVLGLIILAAAFYSWWFIKTTTQQAFEPPLLILVPEPQEPVPPSPIVAFYSSRIIDLKERSPQELKQALTTAFHQQILPDSFTRILVRDRNGYFHISDFLELLEFDLPQGLSDLLGPDYEFGFYGQKQGNRLYLLVEVQDPSEVVKILANWEQDLIKVMQGYLSEPFETLANSFSDNEYLGVKSRFINFFDHSLSIDYALFPDQGFLGFTTSKQSMFRLIEEVLGKRTL